MPFYHQKQLLLPQDNPNSICSEEKSQLDTSLMDAAWVTYVNSSDDTLPCQAKALELLTSNFKNLLGGTVQNLDIKYAELIRLKRSNPTKTWVEIATVVRMQSMSIPLVPENVLLKDAPKVLNQVIINYNQAITKEVKLKYLRLIYQQQTRMGNNLKPSKISASPAYQQFIHVDLFNNVKEQFALLGVDSLKDVLNKEGIISGGADPSPDITIEQILADMSPDKVSRMLEILTAPPGNRTKNLVGLYASDTTKEASAFRTFFTSHSVTFLGGRNSRNFKITDNSNGSSCVLKVENSIDQPKCVDAHLRALHSVNFLTPVTAQRQATYSTNGIEYFTGTLLVTTFCQGSDLVVDFGTHPTDDDRMKAAFNIYRQMGDILVQFQSDGCAFPDMKNSNWLIDHNRAVCVADTKSFVFTDETDHVDWVMNDIKGVGLVYSPHMNPPEMKKNRFSADKMHVHLLGKNLYQYLAKSPPKYLFERDDGNDYDFQGRIFQTTKGQKLEELIKKMIKPKPGQRISLQEALSALMGISLHYEYSDTRASRRHISAASTTIEKYKLFFGDILKTNILLDAKDRILTCNDASDIEAFKAGFSEEIKILKQGQGAFTKIFGLKTSSFEAFNQMIKDREDELKIQPTNPRCP